MYIYICMHTYNLSCSLNDPYHIANAELVHAPVLKIKVKRFYVKKNKWVTVFKLRVYNQQLNVF